MKTRPCSIFHNRIHNAAKNKEFPLRVMFELTYRCNFHCRHCYIPSKFKKTYSRQELNTKQVFSILTELKKLGCFYLGFTGGELFMRNDILDILGFAKASGFQVIVYTNGSLIDEGVADELARLRLNKVDITIPAMTKKAFENITGVRGSRDKVFEAAKLLHERRVSLGFKTCVLKENEDQIEDIRNFSASMGALYRLDDMLSARLDGSKTPFRYLTLKRNRINAKALVTVPEASKNCDFENSLAKTKNEDLLKCGAGLFQAAITPQGELKLCLLIDYPKYKILDNKRRSQKAALRQPWERLKMIAASIKPDKNYKCNRCDFVAFCKWCPARGWLYKRSFTACDLSSRTKKQFLKAQSSI